MTDTDPLVWYREGNARLSQAARGAFEEPGSSIVVPTIVLVEISFLYSRQRIAADVAATLDSVAATANSALWPLDQAVVEHLPTTLNIHDAIIVATAVMYRGSLGQQVRLITKDREIVRSGLVDVVW